MRFWHGQFLNTYHKISLKFKESSKHNPIATITNLRRTRSIDILTDPCTLPSACGTAMDTRRLKGSSRRGCNGNIPNLQFDAKERVFGLESFCLLAFNHGGGGWVGATGATGSVIFGKKHRRRGCTT